MPSKAPGSPPDERKARSRATMSRRLPTLQRKSYATAPKSLPRLDLQRDQNTVFPILYGIYFLLNFTIQAIHFQYFSNPSQGPRLTQGPH